ncbi:hypothetical protein [Haloferula sargassicola]|uniref:Uncharacterized protein n=1 Tax=Haloferula sargassicola TaxID=490096 RepID=A0ABP9UNK9_9BACT
MKSKFILFMAVTGLGAASDQKPVWRDAATHEQLDAQLTEFRQHDPMSRLEAVTGQDPTKINQPVDLLEQSDIISFGGFTTLVPKQAILTVPDDYKAMLEMKPGNQIVGWAEFYARNRGWITTVEVTRVQAEGNEALAKEKREAIEKSSNLVVAVYKGGPISVLPLKVDPASVVTQNEEEQ